MVGCAHSVARPSLWYHSGKRHKYTGPLNVVRNVISSKNNGIPFTLSNINTRRVRVRRRQRIIQLCATTTVALFVDATRRKNLGHVIMYYYGPPHRKSKAVSRRASDQTARALTTKWKYVYVYRKQNVKNKTKQWEIECYGWKQTIYWANYSLRVFSSA